MMREVGIEICGNGGKKQEFEEFWKKGGKRKLNIGKRVDKISHINILEKGRYRGIEVSGDGKFSQNWSIRWERGK